MQPKELLDKSEKLQAFTIKYKEALTQKKVDKAFQKSGMVPTYKMQENIESVQEQGRLLNIGVIGRVKAGKSSLLNSLFFNGQSVLPKAATPMTAALTTMTYGKEIKAKVQFYSEKDLQIIKELANQYTKEFEREKDELRKQKRQRLMKKFGNRLNGGAETEGFIDDTKIDEDKIIRRAKTKLSENLALNAAHIQQKELNKSINPQLMGSSCELIATSIEDLQKQLSDYVGVEGKFTAYTKSVDLYLPFPDLDGIKVIDTPGVNDPIVSREQRTNELLMSCDVVFIVSPAGKYFDIKDQQLMTRLTTKEGLQHIYFVASQADSTLNAPEFSNQPLAQILPKLSQDLIRHLDTELSKMSDFSKDFIESIRSCGSLTERFTLVSAMADSISKKHQDDLPLDDDEKHALSSIEQSFSIDYQTNPQRCLQNLSGTERVKQFIEQSKQEKATIISERQNQVVEQYRKILSEYCKELNEAAKSRCQEIEDVDLVALEQNRKGLEYIRLKLENALESEYVSMKRALVRDFDGVDAVLNKCTEKLLDKTERSLSTESITRTRKKWIFFSEDYTDYRKVLNSTNISRELSQATNKYKLAVHSFFNDLLGKNTFETKLVRNLFGAFQLVYSENEVQGVNIESVKKILREIVENIPIVKINKNIKVPEELKNAGLLYGYSAQEFHDKALSFIEGLNEDYRELSEEYAISVLKCLPEKVSDSLFGELDKQIAQAKDDVEYRNQKLFLLNEFHKEVKGFTL